MTSPPLSLSSKKTSAASGVSFPASAQLLLDLAVQAAGGQATPAERVDERRLERGAAEAGHETPEDLAGKLSRVHQRERVLDVRLNRIERRADFHDGLGPPRDAEDGAGDVQSTDGLGKALVVRKDDDLAGPCGVFEGFREAVHAGRIHRLHGIVDDDEPERAFGERRPGQEQTQGERVQFPLAHHAERSRLHSVDGDVQCHAALALGPRQLDATEFHVALLPEMLPRHHRLVSNRRKALVADLGRRFLEPRLRGLDTRDVFSARPSVSR